jgi:HK97 family phage major capsid protein
MGVNSHANDAMIRRLEKELEERNSAAQGLIANAQDGERDLNSAEKETLEGLRGRMTEIRSQLNELESTAEMATQVAERMKQIDVAVTQARRVGATTVEYRSAGAWALDSYKASTGNREAQERLEVFHRAAAHQKTGDNLGIIPDPIVGSVINFIDAARPIVSFVGTEPMVSATWHRPKVTQGTTVGTQGSAGAAGDEKAELDSQKMLITRLTANAVTYGGYVNVSRQNIDFSTPQALDTVINDLAARYAISTEAAAGAALNTGGTTSVLALSADADAVAAAVWTAAANVYTAVRGQGRLFIAVAPNRLAQFGPLFAPVNPRASQSPGFEAGRFGQGVMGTISGIPVVMSAGLANDAALVASTAGTEFYEQRVGTLQVTEPSVLGVQVAYAGYFTPLTVEANSKHRFTTA